MGKIRGDTPIETKLMEELVYSGLLGIAISQYPVGTLFHREKGLKRIDLLYQKGR